MIRDCGCVRPRHSRCEHERGEILLAAFAGSTILLLFAWMAIRCWGAL